MVYTYIFQPRAADEYENAFLWYEERSIIAADNFIIAVQEAIALLCKDPYRYRNTYREFREIGIKKYPYNRIYYIDEENSLLVIFSIFHHKRDPKSKF